MNDTYVECLVERKTNGFIKFLKYFLISLTVVLALGSLLFNITVGFILAIVLGVASYFVSTYTDIEFEYLYVDKQISVDKVFAKSKRKAVAKYDVDKMELMAPIKSYKLDDYKNRQSKVVDYSSGVEKQPDRRFVFYYDGKEKVIIEPSEDFVKAIMNVAPRKVVTY